jgi:methionyl-tRNA synthetase
MSEQPFPGVEADEGARRVNVTFSPPTPNGDLHLGHLSGPVLAADVCARSQKILGHDVAFASSTDDNQTYVVTTAQRLGTTPEALIQEALEKVSGSLDVGGVDIDLFARPDEEYERFVREFFTFLWRHGAFDLREVELPYDAQTGEYKAEAFVTGRCPICLAHARAGVCEACGLYNLPGALLAGETDGAAALPRRPVAIWVLDLERHRALLENWYRVADVRFRPDLAGVVDATLSGRLPYIPITYPTTWGIGVDWDGPDTPPQAINAWPEIFVGHLFWLSRARRDRAPGCDELVQFIGIDNGFYNAFVYTALALLAAHHGMPIELPKTRTITNQYFQLEGRKFSTSKGDVIWAHDFLRRAGRDRSRFVLALGSPELQRAEFSEPIADDTLAERFDRPLAAIRAAAAGLSGRTIDAPAAGFWTRALDASVRQFEKAYALDTFSIRGAAEALALHLEVLATRLPALRGDDQADVAGALTFLWALRTLAWPVTPDLAAEIAAAFGAPEDTTPRLRDLMPPSGAFRGLSATAGPSEQTPGQAAPVRVSA